MSSLGQALRITGIAALILGGLWIMFAWRPASAPAQKGEISLSVKSLPVGLWPQGMANGAALAAFQKENPDINVRRWSSFRLPGDLSIAAELMAFAAKTAPDVTFTYIHRLQFYIEQGFYLKLNEFIGDDENGDGVLDPGEVRWKPWLDIPPKFRQMGMRGTDIFALPLGNYFSLMVYRRDLLAAAGQPPDTFPKDFESFFRLGQKVCALSLKNPGSKRIYAMSRNLESFYQMLVWSAGGTLAVGDIRNADGELLGHVTPDEILGEKIRSLGLRPSDVHVDWRTVFDSDASVQALGAIWRMCWQPWFLNPNTGEPQDLSAADAARGTALCPKTGEVLDLTKVPGGVQRGICRPARTGESLGESDLDLLRDGELAIMTIQNTGGAELAAEGDRFSFALPPSLEVGGTPAVTAIPMLYGLNSDLTGARRAAAWKFLSYLAGGEWKRRAARHLADHGFERLISPLDAKRLGMTDVLARMPPGWVEMNRQAMEVARVIPYFSGYQQAETEFMARTVRKISDSPDVDVEKLAAEVQDDVESRILRAPGEGRGPLAYIVTGVSVALGGALVLWGILAVSRMPGRAGGAMPAAAARSRLNYAFWFLLFPALLSVLLWNYYPAVRGLLLAFQEYRLDGTVTWVGLANFVEGVWSARFWYTIWNSLLFIVLNVGLGFVAPIVLAVMLHEIPLGKYLFRTVFFLPSVTSSLVIMLLWMVIYDPAPDGTLNQILHPLIEAWNGAAPQAMEVNWPVRWLQDPRLAMLCVIVPMIWASAGTGCLIYLAALQSISLDIYEAAEIDGAGFSKKVRFITLPYLRPLLVINLIGVFIGSAHGWSNIFVMTGGGPDLSTQVAALEIWMNSFVFLRFGMATAQAWVLGAMLMGFTVWQIKQMQKLDFRKVEGK